MSETSKEIIKLFVTDEQKNKEDDVKYNIKLEIHSDIDYEGNSDVQSELEDFKSSISNPNDCYDSEEDDDPIKINNMRQSKFNECISDEDSNENANMGEPEMSEVKSRILTCAICNYTTYVKRTLNRHMITHMEFDPLACKICGACNESKDELDHHLNQHRSSENKKLFKCNICDYNSNISNVFYHTFTHYSEKKKFLCDKCDFTSTCISALKKHERIHKATYTTCPICLKDFETTQQRRIHLQRYRCPDNPKVFKCPECAYVSTFRNLKRHMVTHRKTDEIDWKHCSYCQFKTKRRADLIRHERVIHHTGEKIKCQYCKYSSNDVHNITRHVKKQHPKFAKGRDCGICGFRTFTDETFESHMKSHKHKREYFSLCSLCGFQCVSQKILDKHLKRHEAFDVNYNELQCDLCGFLAENEEYAVLHETTHKIDNEYRCRECSFHVPFKRIFVNHLKVHDIDVQKIFSNSSTKSSNKPHQVKEEVIDVKVEDEVQEKNRKKKNVDDKSCLKCVLCDYTSKLRLLLYRHMGSHGQEYLQNFQNYIQII